MVVEVFNDDEREIDRKDRDRGGLELAIVSTVRDNANHQVKCRVLSPTEQENQPITASVISRMQGDVAVPRKGDLVVLATNVQERPIVLGTLYARGEAMPSYKKEERLISHPHTAARVLIEEDGEILIESDGGDKVRVNSGSGVLVESDSGDTVNVTSNDGVLVQSSSGDKVKVTTSGKVVVNDGTNPVVTDVTGEDTDGSGDIDTLTVTKSNDLQVP